VADVHRQRSDAALRTELEALTTGLAEVSEVPESCLVGGDEEDVVAVLRVEESRAPRHASARTSDAGLERPCHDLRERWITRHRVRQLARLLRIRAAELDRRRCAAALVVAGIDVGRSREIERNAERRIEAVERVIAVERAMAATRLETIAILDRCAIVASG